MCVYIYVCVSVFMCMLLSHTHKDAWTVITHTHAHTKMHELLLHTQTQRCMDCYNTHTHRCMKWYSTYTHTHTQRCMNCYSIHTHVHTHRMMRELLSIHMRTPIHTSASSLHSPGKARLVCIWCLGHISLEAWTVTLVPAVLSSCGKPWTQIAHYTFREAGRQPADHWMHIMDNNGDGTW